MAAVEEPRAAASTPAAETAVLPRSPRALVFRLGGRVLAAATGAGGRVIEIESWTRVPTGPAHLLGLANAQGAVLPVVDARPLLGLPVAPWPWPLRALVAGGDELRAALAVEEVLGFEPCPSDRIEPLGDGLPGGLRAHGRGVLALPRWRAVLIDLPRIFAALRVKRAS
jgi:purine-binding chemotaxis protein CheW